MEPKPVFRSGGPCSTSMLTALVNTVARRLTGGKGVNVRVFGDRIVIESTADVWRIRRG